MDSLILKNNINSLITDRIIKDGDIPRWLLVEVLIRLPQKSIFRCKLVSKQWLSIILDPYFVRLYCSRALSFPRFQHWTLFRSRMYLNDSERPHFLDYDLLDKRSSFYPLFLSCVQRPPHDKDHRFYGVSNGLVLYKFMDEGIFYTTFFRICNPATGQWLALPPHRRANDLIVRGYGKDGALGFVANVEDGVLSSFTVVRMFESHAQTKLTSCEVFFSEIGEWKMYNVHIDIPIKISFKRNCQSTALNGIIYWILCENVLIAYDPRKSPDQAHIIALPETCYNRSLCSAYQGQLRYFTVSYMSGKFRVSGFSIWVMNKGDWYLQHRVSHVDIIRPRDLISRLEFLEPLSFHPNDSDIVYLTHYGMLILYNIKTRKLEVEEDFEGTDGGITLEGVCLLMIPPWPTSCCHPSIRPLRGLDIVPSPSS